VTWFTWEELHLGQVYLEYTWGDSQLGQKMACSTSSETRNPFLSQRGQQSEDLIPADLLGVALHLTVGDALRPYIGLEQRLAPLNHYIQEGLFIGRQRGQVEGGHKLISYTLNRL
jgi:hypothetical protein